MSRDSPPSHAVSYSPSRGLTFSRREIGDLLAAWVALSVAFALFLERGTMLELFSGPSPAVLHAVGIAVGQSLVTVGIGFLLHELAHKVVAVRFDQIAEFRADYNMLAFAIVAALAGFLFAAPGAVYHRGRITERENGIIALAGPVTNIVLAVLFLPLVLVGGLVGFVGALGVTVNVFLAGFNMLPIGPLDGRTVWRWSPLLYLLVAVPSIGLALLLFFG